MGFYSRKSLKAGPFRFNFSKKGVGVSVGFSLFRVGIGPRGNYVRIGPRGFSYNTTLPAEKKTKAPQLEQDTRRVPTELSSVEMKEIESTDVLQLKDSSSTELLDEMNMKFKKKSIKPFILTLLTINIILFLLDTSSMILLIPLPFLLAAVYWAARRDQRVKTVVLFYELDETTERAYQCLHDAFNDLKFVERAWHIAAAGEITKLAERKRQAGAHTLVDRQSTGLSLNAPPFVSTNIVVPGIMVGKQTMYFFPDRVLIYQKGYGVGAIAYSDIRLEIGNTNFIESDSVPGDTQIVGHTWKYVNKKGGPDRRYKDNIKLPICLYSELHFHSPGGLNELIQLSKPGIGANLLAALKKMAAIIK